jgi:hypothetical protein
MWKARYFVKHPDADANKDGKLSWPEYKAHKALRDAEQRKKPRETKQKANP